MFYHNLRVSYKLTLRTNKYDSIRPLDCQTSAGETHPHTPLPKEARQTSPDCHREGHQRDPCTSLYQAGPPLESPPTPKPLSQNCHLSQEHNSKHAHEPSFYTVSPTSAPKPGQPPSQSQARQTVYPTSDETSPGTSPVFAVVPPPGYVCYTA